MGISAVDKDIIDASSAFCIVNTILLPEPLLLIQFKPLRFLCYYTVTQLLKNVMYQKSPSMTRIKLPDPPVVNRADFYPATSRPEWNFLYPVYFPD